MTGSLERRTLVAPRPLELRGDAVSQGFDGYAAVFNTLSADLGGFREEIAPGFFADVLSNDVRSLVNHDPSMVLGRNTSGTLRLAEDNVGLSVSNDFPTTSYARDLAVLIERGDVNQMSFGFRVLQDDWTVSSDGTPIRRLLKARSLVDVSVVTYPAYPDTSAALRSTVVPAEVRSLIAIAAQADVPVPDLAAAFAEVRAGAVLSRKNVEIVTQARDALDALLSAAAPAEKNSAGTVSASDQALIKHDLLRRSLMLAASS